MRPIDELRAADMAERLRDNAKQRERYAKRREKRTPGYIAHIERNRRRYWETKTGNQRNDR